jgi:hypothetical protein
MTAQNPTPDDLRTIARNLEAEGHTSRAEVLNNAADEFARLQVIERVFFKLVSPDGFHQCGTNEECPECDEVGTHAEGCELDAVLNEAK